MIQIIDYGAGNLRSVENALKQIGKEYVIIDDPEKLNLKSKVIFPGVGAAGAAMAELKKRGFSGILKKLKAPFLGICLGMQLCMEFSEENETACLKLIPGQVKRFVGNVKVPQIGWNKVKQMKSDPIFKGIKTNDYFYFVNSYFVSSKPQFVLGTTSYATDFCSVIKRKKFYGVQFHPEKSGETGLKLLNNFCNL